MAHEHIDWKWPMSKIIEDAPELLGYDKANLIDWLHNIPAIPARKKLAEGKKRFLSYQSHV